MQVFVPYSEPLKVAQCLDPKRLNKQIIECAQIINAIKGTGKGWLNHPIVRMYEKSVDWLVYYFECLLRYKRNELWYASVYNNKANASTPFFLTEEFCNQHKRRLYTKNPEYYKKFAEYGKSEENWYFVNDEIVKYINGKRV